MSRRSAPDQSGYLAQDTIAALSSAVGGAIAVIRVSGPKAPSILDELAGEALSAGLQARMAKRVRLRDEAGRTLDDAVVILFRAPKSFTGEDSVELHVHGGGFIASRTLEAVIERGARPALPGEFSFRAVRNGKMAIGEAEAIADLIGASNGAAADLALEKMSGSQSRLIVEMAEELRQLATLGEIGIDFADQDVDEVSLVNLKKRISSISARLIHLRDSFGRGSKVQDGVRVAFVGLPNAGKSSFFNVLLGEDRSIVSEIAGTTRDVVRERLTLTGTLGSVTLRLEDTAGLRQAEDRIEQMGIERTEAAARDADLILWVVDPTGDAAEFKALEEEWTRLGKPVSRTIGIASKRDLASDAQQKTLKSFLVGLGISQAWSISSSDHSGVSEAARAIADFSQKWVRRDPGEVLLTRLEHAEAVRSALEHLERALQASEIDLFASDLRQALFALNPLIGDTLPDDILGRVFSQFCIGK